MDILEHLGMKVPDIEGHGVIISRANATGCAAGLLCLYSGVIVSQDALETIFQLQTDNGSLLLTK